MLYIFAGFPENGLHAGGLQHCIEEVEELALLEHHSPYQVRREGVFMKTPFGEEQIGEFEAVLSDMLNYQGITEDWFPPWWTFGNGITMCKSSASPELKTVIHGTDLSEDEFLELNGPTATGNLVKERKHIRHESWRQYESRWLPGTCPQEAHVVSLTCLIINHKLPNFAYERIRKLVEEGMKPTNLQSYSSEPGKHFLEVRRYDGKSAFGRG